MIKDKIIKDLKERNDKLKNQYYLQEIRLHSLEYKNNKQKEVLDKALCWISENTHYTDFNVDKLVLDENANLKELLELLEEIE